MQTSVDTTWSAQPRLVHAVARNEDPGTRPSDYFEKAEAIQTEAILTEMALVSDK